MQFPSEAWKGSASIGRRLYIYLALYSYQLHIYLFLLYLWPPTFQLDTFKDVSKLISAISDSVTAREASKYADEVVNMVKLKLEGDKLKYNEQKQKHDEKMKIVISERESLRKKVWVSSKREVFRHGNHKPEKTYFGNFYSIV